MEKFFSLKTLSSNVFTEDTKYKQSSKTLSSHPKYLQNALEQAIDVNKDTSSYTEASLSDALIRIKDVEKDISKNALFSVYEFDSRQKSSDFSLESVNIYNYTNLSNNTIPSLEKLDSILTESSTILDRFNKYSSTDAGEEYLTFLKEETEKISEAIDTVIKDISGMDIDSSAFVEEAYKLFRNGDNMQAAVLEGADVDVYYKVAYEECDNFVNGVEDYNTKLKSCAAKLRHVAAMLDRDAEGVRFSNIPEINPAKKHLLDLLCYYACKYMTHANMVYGFKTSAISNFLHPTSNPIATIVKPDVPAVSQFSIDLLDDDDEDDDEFSESMFDIALENADSEMDGEPYVANSDDIDKMEAVYSTLESMQYLSESVLQEAPQAPAQQQAAPAQQTQQVQQPAANETDVKKAADAGAQAGKQQANTPQENKAVGESIKGKIDAIIDINKKFFVRMMFRANKSAARYSAFGRNYKIDTIYATYNKQGNSDSSLYPAFKGDINLANQRIHNLFNSIRSKTLSNLAGKGSDEEFFVSRIADANLNAGDIKMITDYFMGNDSGQVEIPFRAGTSKQEFAAMIDSLVSAEMDQNKFANNINSIMDEAVRFAKSAVQEAVDYSMRDVVARERLAGVLEEYFGKEIEAFKEAPEQQAPQQNAPQQQTQAAPATGNTVGGKGAEIVQIVTNYCSALKKVCAAAKTAHEALLSHNKKILDLLQSGNPQKANEEKQQEQQPAQGQQQAQPQQQQQAAPATNQ